MTQIDMQKSTIIIGIIVLVVVLTAGSCCFLGSTVSFSPDAYYVADRKDVLSISGTTASHARLGLFTVESPPVTNKVYKGEDNSNLVFTHDGGITTASITTSDGTIKKYYFCGFGAVEKKRILGIFLPTGRVLESQ
jgi:hypothetical protein